MIRSIIVFCMALVMTHPSVIIPWQAKDTLTQTEFQLKESTFQLSTAALGTNARQISIDPAMPFIFLTTGGAGSLNDLSPNNGEGRTVGKDRYPDNGPGFSIVGNIINLSGSHVNFQGNVVLTINENGLPVKAIEAPALPDLSFVFEDVPYSDRWTYSAAFLVNGVEFRSQEFSGDRYMPGDTVAIQISVFDTTYNSSFLRGEGIRVVFNFDTNGYVHISEGMMFHNPTSLVILPVDEDTPVIKFDLDNRAESLIFLGPGDSNIYQATIGGFGDWRPIFPGDVHQVMFEYDLPFDGDETIQLALPMRMDSIIVIKEDSNGLVSCKSPFLNADTDNDSGTTEYFKGLPGYSETSLSLHCVSRNKAILYVMGTGFLLVCCVFLFLVLLRRHKRKMEREAMEVESQRTRILDTIIALEDRYKANELSKESYEAKRTELIKKLENKD